MKKKLRNCLSLALALSLSLTNVLPAFADEENGIANETIMNNEVDNSKLEKTDVNDIDNESTYEESNEKNSLKEKVTQDFIKEPSAEESTKKENKENINVLSAQSGQIGECSWTEDEEGTVTIFGDGKAMVPLYTADLPQNMAKIIVKKGVQFPKDSSDLFNGFQGEEIELHNNTSNVTDMSSMFLNCRNLKKIKFGTEFYTRNVMNMKNMFESCWALTELDVSDFEANNVTNMSAMFHSCYSLTKLDLSKFDTKKVTHMGSMFLGCGSLKELNLSGFKTDNVISMGNMFDTCKSLQELDLSDFDTNNVLEMGGMFTDCSLLTKLDVSSFNTTNVENMMYMFSGCSLLTELDLSSFNTTNVENMMNMFSGCNSLKKLDVSSFNTTNVISMFKMFSGCSSLTKLDVSKFDTTNTYMMDFMFENCGDNLKIDLSSFKYPPDLSFFLENADIQELKLNNLLPDGLLNGLRNEENPWVKYKDGTRDAERYFGSREEFANYYEDNKDTGISAGTYVRIKEHNVVFDGNGSTNGLIMDEKKYYDGKEVTLPTNKFEKEGYTFIGWNTKTDNTGHFYHDEDNFTQPVGTDMDITLYAQWEKIPPEEKETKALAIKANDLNINLNEASKLTDKEVLNKSEAKVYEETLKAGEVISSKLVKDVEIKVNADDLEKIISTKETGVFKIRLTATNEIGTAEKEIEVTVEGEPVTIEEKSVEIEASDFSTSIKELEKTKSLEKLILEKSKAKAFYVEKNSLGEETKRKQIDVKINADDLDKLKAAKKAGDYRIRLSAEEEDVNNDMVITVKVKKSSEKPSKETPKDKDKERPLKDKINKKSKNNSKTGVAGIAGVAALLAVASGAYISSKRK